MRIAAAFLILVVVGLAAAAITATAPAAMGQTPQTTTITTTPFTDDTGFTVDLAQGWIANDYDNRGTEALTAENELGYAKLVTFCPETDALPSLGSDVPTCSVRGAATDYVEVFRYKDLNKRPELANIVPITAHELFLYHLEELKHASPDYPPNIQEENTRVVEVERILVGPNGQQTSMPATGLIVYIDNSINLYVLDEGTSMGYRVSSDSFSVGMTRDPYLKPLPEAMQMIFESISITSDPYGKISAPAVTHLILPPSLPQPSKSSEEPQSATLPFFDPSL